MAEVKTRNYGVDLLRIVSMLMVVVLHVLGQGGVLKSSPFLGPTYAAAWLLELACYCSVNTYALISGYVGYESRFRLANLAVICLQATVYTLGVFLLRAVLRPGSVGLADVPSAAFPYLYAEFWYVTAYFCMFFFIPFMNTLVRALDRRGTVLLIVVIIVLCAGLPMAMRKDYFRMRGGHSVLWLALLYLLGASLKKLRLEGRFRTRTLACGYALAVVVSWLGKLAVEWTRRRLTGVSAESNWFVSHTTPLHLLAAIFLLLCFAQARPGRRLVKFTAFFAPAAFGVYLIHEEKRINSAFVVNRFLPLAAMPWPLMMLCALGGALGIWLVCSLLDKARAFVFQKLRVRERLIAVEGPLGFLWKE